mgnify:CR=1 FL=1
MDEALGALDGAAGGQLEFAAHDQARQGGEQLAAEQRLDDPRGQEVTATGSASLLGSQPAVGGERMNVRMQSQRTRPGRESEQQPGRRTR